MTDTKLNFTPTKWATAADKERFFKQFQRLVKGGFRMSLFPKTMYSQLMHMFGHIAHFNQAGFYDHWFHGRVDQIAFIEHALNAPSYGSPAHTWCDVEQAIQAWLRENPQILQTLRQHQAEAVEQAERDELARLKGKYE